MLIYDEIDKKNSVEVKNKNISLVFIIKIFRFQVKN